MSKVWVNGETITDTELNRIEDSLDKLQNTPWQLLSLQNDASNYSASYTTPRYRIVGDVVELEGTFKFTTKPANTVSIATLPVEYRPAKTMLFSGPVAGVNQFARYSIAPNGEIEYLSALSSTTITWLSLTGIQFSVLSDSSPLEGGV